MNNDKEIVTELTNIISNKEYISEMLETMKKVRAMTGVYLAISDISSYDEIENLIQIRNVATAIADLINFYI
jgi:hypothetical protein